MHAVLVGARCHKRVVLSWMIPSYGIVPSPDKQPCTAVHVSSRKLSFQRVRNHWWFVTVSILSNRARASSHVRVRADVRWFGYHMRPTPTPLSDSCTSRNGHAPHTHPLHSARSWRSSTWELWTPRLRVYP